MAPYSEKEPSSKYYKFFVYFYESPFLQKIGKSSLSLNFLFRIINYKILYIIYKIFSILILLLRFISPSIYFVKLEYRINFFFYKWFLKYEYVM
jgi:hypothetical protein